MSAMVVTVGADGRVYVSDWGNGRVQVFDAAGTLITAWGQVGTGQGELINPVGVMMGADGNVWVVEHGNNRVQQFSPDGRHLGSLVGRRGVYTVIVWSASEDSRVLSQYSIFK